MYNIYKISKIALIFTFLVFFLVTRFSTFILADPSNFSATFATPVTFQIYGDHVYVDQNSNITTDVNFTDGYIRYSVAGGTVKDFLRLFSDPDETANGAISLSGSGVYLGDGTTKKIIGTIDPTENGQNGQALKINLANAFTNNSFETGGLTGWTVVTDFMGLPGDTPSSVTQSASIDPSYHSHGAKSLLMQISGSVTTGYGTAHGPMLVSNTFEGSAGDTIAFDWRVEDSGDDADVYAYLVDGENTYQISYARVASFQDWSTIQFILPVTSSDFQFKFVCGTYDATGGRAVGSKLWIDNVRVYSDDITEYVLQTVARQIQYKCTADILLDTKTINIQFTTGDSNLYNYSKVITMDNTLQPFTTTVSVNGNTNIVSSKTINLNIFGQYARAGVSQMMISDNPDFDEAVWEAYSNTTSHSLTGISGNKDIYVKLKDGLGNISALRSVTVMLDKDKPYFQLEIVDPSKKSRTSKTISAKSFDLHSCVKYTKYAMGVVDSTYFGHGGILFDVEDIEVTENGVYTFYAIDNLGNACVQNIEVTQIVPFEYKEVDSVEVYLRYQIKRGTQLSPENMIKLFDKDGIEIVDKEISATSLNEDVLKQNADGSLTAICEGAATITLNDVLSGYTADIKVRVENVSRSSFKYSDVIPSNWATPSIIKLTDISILKGYTDGMYKPNNGISFKEFMVIYDRMKLYMDPDPYMLRNEINAVIEEDSWGYYNIMDMFNMMTRTQVDKLVTVTTSFESLITRAQAAFIIANLENFPSYTGKGYYSDTSQDPFEKEINVTTFYNIFNGYTDKLFGPDLNITRAETAVIFSRLLDK